MKSIAITVGVIAVMIGVLQIMDFGVVEYVNQEPEIVEVHPEWATDEEAVKAAQDVLRRKELERELDDVQAQINALSDQRDAIEEELEQY